MKSPNSSPQATPQTSRDRKFLEIEQIVKSYPRKDGSELVILDRIDLTIGAAEFISVIGHSGCCKSTLL